MPKFEKMTWKQACRILGKGDEGLGRACVFAIAEWAKGSPERVHELWANLNLPQKGEEHHGQR